MQIEARSHRDAMAEVDACIAATDGHLAVIAEQQAAIAAAMVRHGWPNPEQAD